MPGSAGICEKLKAEGLEGMFRERTGLLLDAYFSGTKLKWLLDQVSGLRSRAEFGELAFGTVDSWLIARLTGGRVHATDFTNASRTLMFNIHDRTWDPDLLHFLDIPLALLPQVVPSARVAGRTEPAIVGAEIPIAGIAGDQQAALFGQACFEAGQAKNTYVPDVFCCSTSAARALIQAGAAVDPGLRPRRAALLCPGRLGVHRRRRCPVVARRTGADPYGGGDPGAGG